MYVDFQYAQETAKAIANTDQYITNHLLHSAIIQEPKDVMTKLFDLSKRLLD